MSEHEFDCAAAASFLDAGREAARAAHAAAVIAALGFLLSGAPWPRAAFGAALILWPLICFFAMRVALDASLFRAIAPAPEERSRRLDQLLTAWGLGGHVRERAIADRCRGAFGLCKRLAILSAIQMMCVVAGVFLAAVGES